MMEVAEDNTQKARKSKKVKRKPVLPSSAVGKNGDLYLAVAGFIESDKCTVAGGLIGSCCSLLWDRHCLFRVSSKHVIFIVNSSLIGDRSLDLRLICNVPRQGKTLGEPGV